ncbi:DCC1-like thiol-disulfide oxidoreductase family protein [Pricia sp. S334]|uniref:DCC1-like thiol-disulfide oxidoreductase family protein n=1 Tax=Pricia mediterranea TaxID=3076079 RepID=A0ABU3L2I3_9FLAO|nr:DCC1-like thiol-disulfide oxidoreductase family protein [Pricia sp. S334]MDT7827608.1 DCC1-like thiol-disulfide oxidoreductase family protein [Pricia sp. S334]
MTAEPDRTTYRPEKPLLVWDGQCGFCKYWVTRWKKITGDAVRYVPYQDIHEEIPDIPKEAFQKAVRLILSDGRVISGAGAAYRTLEYSKTWNRLYGYYQKSQFFRTLSDLGYSYVADHRPFMYNLTQAFFGEDPNKPKPYWVFYLVGIIVLILVFV